MCYIQIYSFIYYLYKYFFIWYVQIFFRCNIYTLIYTCINNYLNQLLILVDQTWLRAAAKVDVALYQIYYIKMLHWLNNYYLCIKSLFFQCKKKKRLRNYTSMHVIPVSFLSPGIKHGRPNQRSSGVNSAIEWIMFTS